MAIDKITTHQQDAKDRLLEQYKGKPLIAGRLDAFTEQIQDLETGICTLIGRLDIPNAEGNNLDRIGEIVNEPRLGRTDAEYRLAIYARIGINTSRGLPEELISLWNLIIDPTPTWVFLQNLGSGNIHITSDHIFADQDEVNAVIATISPAIAGGVRLQYIICADTTDGFQLGGSALVPGNPDVNCLGFDDGTSTVGGELAVSYQEVFPFAFEGGSEVTAGFGAATAGDPTVGGALQG